MFRFFSIYSTVSVIRKNRILSEIVFSSSFFLFGTLHFKVIQIDAHLISNLIFRKRFLHIDRTGKLSNKYLYLLLLFYSHIKYLKQALKLTSLFNADSDCQLHDPIRKIGKYINNLNIKQIGKADIHFQLRICIILFKQSEQQKK